MPAPELAPRRRTELRESLGRLRSVVSPYTGIVRSTTEFMSMPDGARLVKVGCRLSDSSAIIGCTAPGNPGGSSSSREKALAAALGEAVERYSASYLPRHEFRLGCAEEVGPDAVAPERFALFREDQYAACGFPFSPFARQTHVRWIEGFSLPDGRPALLPVQLVYLPFERAGEQGEVAIGYATSSGLACGATLEEAILAGLLEVLERDAFMVTWYSALSLPRLTWHDDRELRRHAERFFAPTGLRYAAIDLSCFWNVPTVLGIVRSGESDTVGLAVGAASGPSVAEAWKAALAEAFAVRAWARSLTLESPAKTFAADFTDVESFDDHVLFHADPENASLAAFLDASPAVRRTADVVSLEGNDVLAQIEALTDQLRARSVTAYAVDVTAPDVRPAGLRVAKVVAPELCALDAAYLGRFLGGRRLYDAAFELGLRANPLSPEDVNPYPHPFP